MGVYGGIWWDMVGYGGIWWDMVGSGGVRGDIGGYGANGARWDPRAHMGPSGRALHWFHIPPYPPTKSIYLYVYIYGLMST